jgi:hypothetical protein
MNPINPYSYVHKVNNIDYALSVFLDPTLNFRATDRLGTAGMALRSILFTQIAPPGTAILNHYPIPNANGASVEVTTFPLNGVPVRDLNRSTLMLGDITLPHPPNNFPDDKRYLPHSYFIKQQSNPARPFKLFLAIQRAAGFAYTITVEPLNLAKHRTITVQEVATAGALTGVWFGESENFAEEGDDLLHIEVLDTMGAKKGEGKIRHSVADIKPFDLGGL